MKTSSSAFYKIMAVVFHFTYSHPALVLFLLARSGIPVWTEHAYEIFTARLSFGHAAAAATGNTITIVECRCRDEGEKNSIYSMHFWGFCFHLESATSEQKWDVKNFSDLCSRIQVMKETIQLKRSLLKLEAFLYRWQDQKYIFNWKVAGLLVCRMV
jgi:hypothetical protein